MPWTQVMYKVVVVSALIYKILDWTTCIKSQIELLYPCSIWSSIFENFHFSSLTFETVFKMILLSIFVSDLDVNTKWAQNDIVFLFETLLNIYIFFISFLLHWITSLSLSLSLSHTHTYTHTHTNPSVGGDNFLWQPDVGEPSGGLAMELFGCDGYLFVKPARIGIQTDPEFYCFEYCR